MADKMKVSLQENEEEYQKKIVKLNEMLDQREYELAELADMKEKNEGLKEGIEQKDETIDNLNNKVNELKEEVDGVNDTLYTKTELIDRIKKENDNLQEELDEAPEKADKLDELQE